LSYKRYFSRFLEADRDRLHFAAHSHHLWPDVSFDAQQRAWLDAAKEADGKWDGILGEVLPKAQSHIARLLNLSDPAQVAFAPNTHELVVRLLSCLEEKSPVRILTTDAEFHSFHRQSRRWEEAGVASVERVTAEPFASFPSRFADRVRAAEYDLVYLSQVFFDSGYVVKSLDDIVAAVPSESTYVVIDGYHGFMALPTDLRAIETRAFYLAGGYKYAMTGEGACFTHCPPGYGTRPVDTGWYAGFDDLTGEQGEEVGYASDGKRFFGATFDATALYRFNAVMDLWQGAGLSPVDIHASAHSRSLVRGPWELPDVPAFVRGRGAPPSARSRDRHGLPGRSAALRVRHLPRRGGRRFTEPAAGRATGLVRLRRDSSASEGSS
jgi:selenocysteine lyase/cysteine desulfurase